MFNENDVRRLRRFLDELSFVRRISPYEREYLDEAAQRGADELMTALNRTMGSELENLLAETAQCCAGQTNLILDLISLAGAGCSEAEWQNNREGILDCLAACECAMELAERFAPETRLRIASCVEQCRLAERKCRLKILV